MAISAHKLCRLAAQLASEHGVAARDYARRAYLELETDGYRDHAKFWFTLSVLLDDVVAHRTDPERLPTIH
jgi:hypothetical protein